MYCAAQCGQSDARLQGRTGIFACSRHLSPSACMGDLVQVGQFELAERLYKEVLHIDPWHKRALVAYALMLQEKLAQVGRATLPPVAHQCRCLPALRSASDCASGFSPTEQRISFRARCESSRRMQGAAITAEICP